MAIAIADEHVQLAAVASSFMKRHGERTSARLALEAATEELPEFWDDLRELGWLGLHLPEEYGGSGYGLEELAVVVEELGRAIAAGPYVPCAIAGAVIAAAGSDEVKQRLLPGLADGSTLAGIAVDGQLEVRDGADSADSAGKTVNGLVEAVLGGGLADLFVLTAGDDVVLVDAGASGVQRSALKNLDPSRRSVQLTLDGAPAEVLPGAGRLLLDITRFVFAAEAVGMAQACVAMASEYAAHPHPVRPRRSPCSKRSSTTAPTWPSPLSSPRPRCGTPRAPRPPAATSSPTPPQSAATLALPAADLDAPT